MVDSGTEVLFILKHYFIFSFKVLKNEIKWKIRNRFKYVKQNSLSFEIKSKNEWPSRIIMRDFKNFPLTFQLIIIYKVFSKYWEWIFKVFFTFEIQNSSAYICIAVQRLL